MFNKYKQLFLISFTLLFLPLLAEAQQPVVYTTDFTVSNAALGYKDNAELQKALTHCSLNGAICIIPANKTYYITTDLFIWGNASLIGGGPKAGISFKPIDGGRSLLQVGVMPGEYDNGMYPLPLNYELTLHSTPYTKNDTTVFKGKISGLKLEIDSNVTKESVKSDFDFHANNDPLKLIFRSDNDGIAEPANRLIWFWQVNGGELSNNYILLNNSMYGATSSGNNNKYVTGGLIRKDIRIVNNVITSKDHYRPKGIGNEGIGLGGFDGAYIAHNTVTGVGDDPIGLHWVNNALVEQNYLDTTDGRIFAAEARCVAILYNDIFRLPLFHDDVAASGSIGFSRESKKPENLPIRPPTQIIIHGNRIISPPGARTLIGAISLKSGRAVSISNNTYYNKSTTSTQSGLVVSYEDRDPAKEAENQNRENAFILGTQDLATYNGCFKNTKTKLPSGVRFLPIDDDNYKETYISNVAGVPNLNYYPVKSIEVKNNNFAPGGNYLKNSIELFTDGNWMPTFGNRTFSACSETQIVGLNKCHSMAFTDNRLEYLPWQKCSATFISNMPNSPNDIPEPNRSNCPGVPNYIEADRSKAPATSPSQEKIYYGNNTTTTDQTPLPSEPNPPHSIPGIVEAEEFSAASYIGSGGAGRTVCNSGEGRVFTSNDITGVCDITPVSGQWTEYKIDVLEDGNYTLIARAGSTVQNSKLRVKIGTTYDVGNIKVANEGVTTYRDIRVGDFNLTKGQHLVTFLADSGNVNLNYLKFQIFRDCTATLACLPSATASSLEGNLPEATSSYAAKYARDGNLATRWSSKFLDPQWIQIDLHTMTPINSVTLVWQEASAKDYTIDVSNDGLTWRTLVTRTGMTSGGWSFTHDFPSLKEYARYVRMRGTARTTIHGYSLWEFKVNGN